jgi:hypothetical protein
MIYIIRYYIPKVISDQVANSVYIDPAAQICRLIWIYTVRPCDKSHTE